jgi:ElaB/YqjD/DUF883 family membrane-anchored ribosome-binding protein
MTSTPYTREEASVTHTTDFRPASEESSTTDQAKEKAQEAAGQAKAKAGSQLRTQVDQRSTDAGNRVGGIASDARSVSETLREQGKDQPAKLVEQAADRADRLGDYLKQSDADRILGDLEDLGRRNPWVVIAGGAALGLVASRFLKASSSRRYDERMGSTARLPARTGVSSSYGGTAGSVTSRTGMPPVPATPAPGIVREPGLTGEPGIPARDPLDLPHERIPARDPLDGPGEPFVPGSPPPTGGR